MKQWWVYELRAGEWFYIGQTCQKLRQRLNDHRHAIRKHKEKPRTGNWHKALNEKPLPEDWNIRPLAGPYATRKEALTEEARLQKEHWDIPGRVWERCGYDISDDTREKLKENHADFSGSNNPMYGKKHTKASNEKRSQSLKAAWARRKQEKAQKSLD